jgi:hypothetical protein
MVQQYQSPVRIYKKPFELVMMAYELRFPTCEMIPIVKETEIIDEEVDENTGVHVIDRRAKLNIDAPYLLKKIMGVEDLIFRQRNTLVSKLFYIFFSSSPMNAPNILTRIFVLCRSNSLIVYECGFNFTGK